MQSTRPTFGFADLKALVARRWWLFLFPMLAVSVGTGTFAYLLPDVYRAETVILVDPPKIPERYIAPISTIEIKDRLETLTQQVMSRTRLEQVIRSLGLFKDDWNDPPAMERRIGSLQRHIDVRVSGNDAFVIGFEGDDPALVQKVANRLAELFIDENSKVRSERAEGTAQFIDLQLRELLKQLDAKEREVRTYREAHLGELPEQREANLRALDSLEARLSDNRKSTQRLLERRALVQQQTAAMRAQSGQLDEYSPLRAELLKQIQTLKELETQYTDRHPDVRMAKQRISEIQAQLKAGGTGVQIPPAPPDTVVRDPVLTSLQRELEQIQLDLSGAQLERQQLERDATDTRAKVANAPRREQEYAQLTRDYQNTKENYQQLLNKKIQAGMAEALERKQASATFTVLDPADLPKTPVKPARAKILLLGIVLGFAVGGGAVYTSEALDQSLRTVEDLKRAYDLPVLGAIPNLAEDEPIRARRKARRAYLQRTAPVARL